LSVLIGGLGIDRVAKIARISRIWLPVFARVNMASRLAVLGVVVIFAFSIDAQEKSVMAQTADQTSPFKSRLTLQNSGEMQL